MKKQFDKLEQQRVKRLAKEYRSQGYRVQIDPDKNSLPSFFGTYRPDLLATRGDEHIAIEVKSRATLQSSEQLADVARAIEFHRGWRLELVVTNPSDAETDELEITRPDLAEKRLQEANELLASGRNESALLLGWAATEAALRQMAQNAGISIKRYQAGYIVKFLYSRGLLTAHEFELLDTFRLSRTEVAHGFEPRPITTTEIRECLDLTANLLARNI